MKAALGQNVKVSLPKAFQTNKQQTKSLAVKGFPTDISDAEFKEFLDLNKITFAKAERLKTKKNGRVLLIFRLEISDPTEAEALISQNLVCHVTGIVYKVEEFRAPISIMQCYNCQCFGHSAKTCRSKQKCLICGENHSHKRCPSRESRKPTCANCNGPTVASYKRCPEYKNMWSTCGQQPKNIRLCCKPKQPPAAPNSSDIQFYSWAANQIRSKRGYPNRPTASLLSQPKTRHSGPEIQYVLKSFHCSQKYIRSRYHCLNLWALSAPLLPKPFTFTSTKVVNSSTKTTSKPSITLKSPSPPNNSTKAVPKQPKSSK